MNNDDKQRQLLDSYAEWLAPYPWNLFATLTFLYKPTASRADRIFKTWIDAIRVAEGTASFCWFRVQEMGAFNDHLHYHALIGGLRDVCKYPWILLWNELAGDCLISYCLPNCGAIRYVLKEVSTDRPFDFDACLDSRRPCAVR